MESLFIRPELQLGTTAVEVSALPQPVILAVMSACWIGADAAAGSSDRSAAATEAMGSPFLRSSQCNAAGSHLHGPRCTDIKKRMTAGCESVCSVRRDAVRARASPAS